MRAPSPVRFEHVRLRAPAPALSELADYYGDRLGVACREASSSRLVIGVGETMLEFIPAAGEPFYHFALLVPGNRFAAALRWAKACTTLLPRAGSSDVVFHFSHWSAQACYFHDPAGNIVELIAHRGIGSNERDGEFAATELLGLSELGLVGDPLAMADELEHRVGLEVWDGSVRALAFAGERARTLILAPVGRGWLPTGRRAQRHELDVVISGAPEGDVALEEARYRITRRSNPDTARA